MNQSPEQRCNEIESRPREMNFDSYSELCDSVDEFRRIGIQDEDAYNKTMADERTIFGTYNNQIVPVLGPLEYNDMYDNERCRQMTDKTDTRLLCVPATLFDRVNEQEHILSQITDDMAVIVERFASPPNFDATSLPKITTANGVKEDYFYHPGLNDAHDTAWMAAYHFTFGPDKDEREKYEGSGLISIACDLWKNYCEQDNRPVTPRGDAHGTFLLTSDQLNERKDIIESLWDISEVGFGKVLGEHHPVSMQMSRDFFDKQIVADNTLTAIHYDAGEPVCFGFIALDMETCPWINTNSTALAEHKQQSDNDHRAYVHFQELISRSEKGAGLSLNILEAFLEVARRTKFEYTLMFESTNLSSLYIPGIIKYKLTHTNGLNIHQGITMLGKLSYSVLTKE